MDDVDILPEGPDGNEQSVDSWSVVPECVGEARFDAGRLGKMWAALKVYMLGSCMPGALRCAGRVRFGWRARSRATDMDLGAG